MNKEELIAAIEKAEELGIDFNTFSKLYKGELSSKDKKEAKSIYLIRHAETEFNIGEEIRIRSIVDLPLCEEGLLAANSAGIALKDTGISCIYTSDMTRAMQTSRAIQLNGNSKIEIYDQFRSWNLGSWAGMLNKDVEPLVLDLIANPNKTPPDSNESYNIFIKRNLEGYKDAIQFDGTIAIVTHQSNCIVILESLGLPTEIEPAQFIKIK